MLFFGTLHSEEDLKIAEKRKETKGKGEKERYTHLNSEFQRIARRDKKNFLSDQCKEIEENNRIGKTRDLFKKIRDTKGTFHAKMGLIKDRNGRDLTEAEDIKKWQEYIEELYKNIFMTQLTTMVTHLEPDILECEIEWALGNTTTNIASGGDEIPVELFQILKKRYYESAAFNMLANLENSAVATGLEKVSFHFNLKERQCQRMLKLLHNCTHLTRQ